ncbi:MAG: nuclear transport factor 2 family protein [Deltaproteobacteria bacterium]|nr:nuclear transport factor 2 family protein [Deltaproteobacteria bacterium]
MGWAAACGDGASPEARVRAAIDRGEEAAERKDVDALMALVHPEYRDEHGLDRMRLRYALRSWLANRDAVSITIVSKELSSRSDEVLATLSMLVEGRTTTMTLTFREDDGEWKVARARYDSPGGF